LRFRAERGCVAGIEVGADSLHFLLCDLSGRELGQTRVPIEKASSSPSIICKKIGQALRELLAKHKQSEDQLLGLAVGVPAIVNVNTGTVVAYSALQDWNLVNLGEMLAREVKCQVTIENDTNLAAQGEFYRGAAQGQKDFVFITIGKGVGAGIFVDGRLHHGSQWSAGEIGYLRVPNISRGHPTIHQYGNLEKLLYAPGILKAWQAGVRATRTKPKVTRASDVFDLALGGNAAAKRILMQRAMILADTILDLALILNPSVILFGGEVGSHPLLLQEVQKLLQGSEFALVQVGLGALGSSAVLWGGI
jgi:glucokinase